MDLPRSLRGAPAQSDPRGATDDALMPDRAADAAAPRYLGPSTPRYLGPSTPHGLPLTAPDNAHYGWNTPREPSYHAQQHYNELRLRNLQNPAFLFSERHPSTPPIRHFDLESPYRWHAQGHEAGSHPLYTLPHRPANLASPRFYHEPHFSSDAGDYSSNRDGWSFTDELPHHSNYGIQPEYLLRRPSNPFPSPRHYEPLSLPFRPPPVRETDSRPVVHGAEGSQKPGVQYWPTGNLGTKRKKSTSDQPQRRPSEPNPKPKKPIPAHLQKTSAGGVPRPKKPIPAHLQRPPGQGVPGSGPLIHAHPQPTPSPPKRGSRTGVDKKTHQKQEAFTKKADARRQSEQLNSGKRSFAHRHKSNSPAATPAKPAKRLKLGSLSAEPAIDSPQYQGCTLPSVSTYDLYQDIAPHPPDWDDLCQPIVVHYEDYNWSVQHYELSSVKSGYDFAEAWLEGLYARQLDLKSTHKRYSHVSKGFIPDGDRLSILVLHNATNPFHSATDSSTTVGVYGRYWHDHNEIHWTTIAPGLRGLFDLCERTHFLREKHRWKVDMPKASDRRFHRAYWLAANCLGLGNLLNHSSCSGDKAHDLVDGADDEPVPFTEDDVGCEWAVSAEQCAEAWAVVVTQNEEMPEPPAAGWDYVVTEISE